MAKTLDNEKIKVQFNIMDALLYVLAGSAMLIISVSFLLWLRFWGIKPHILKQQNPAD